MKSKLLSILIALFMCMFAGQVMAQECAELPYGIEPNKLLEWETIEVNQVNPVTMFLLLKNPTDQGPERVAALLHMRYGVVRLAMSVDGVIHDYAFNPPMQCFVDMPIGPTDLEFLTAKLLPPKGVSI